MRRKLVRSVSFSEGRAPGHSCFSLHCPLKPVSICSYETGSFKGCGKMFCKDHGIPHLLIPTDDVEVKTGTSWMYLCKQHLKL